MKRLTLLGLALLLAFSLFLAPAVQAETTYAYTFDDDIWVTSADGTTLAANVFVPVGTPGQTFPVIVFPNSWALEEHEYFVQAAQFAQEGYVVFSYSARGWGASGGLVNVAGPKDMEDVTACIDWVLANTPADANNIGMAGISYGAGLSLLGAAHDSRVKTVVSMSGWGDVGRALYGAETPRLVWGGILVGSGGLLGRLDPIVTEHYLNVVTHTNVEETLAWTTPRSPITYLDEYNGRQLPIFISQNYQDELFQPNQIIDLYKGLNYPHKKLRLNMGIHFTGEGSGLLGIENEVWTETHRWFAYWLKGENNGIMAEDPVLMKTKNSDTELLFGSWPTPDVTNKTYYLGHRGLFSNGKLNNFPVTNSGTNKIYSGILSGASTGVPVVSPLLEAHTPIDVYAWIPGISRVLAIVYETNSFSSDKHIVGNPALNLWVKPSGSKMQLIAHLYDVDAWGGATLITHGPVTVHNAVPNQPLQLNFEMVTTSYVLPAGHKLALALDTYDPQYGTPTLLPFDVTFYYNSGRVSELYVPFLNE
jgi:predicted acyl esterase